MSVSVPFGDRISPADLLHPGFSPYLIGENQMGLFFPICHLTWVVVLWAGGLTDIMAATAQAAPEPFPRTLTLGQALAMLDDHDPALVRDEAKVISNQAARARLDDRNSLAVLLDLEWRESDRFAKPGHDFVNDSRAILSFDMPLTRFGTDRELYDSLDTRSKVVSARKEHTRAEVRHEIMRSFLEVILSDYAYAAQDEVMTLAFLTYDRQRERMERYSEVAPVEVHRLESDYLDAFAERTRLGLERRLSRLRLALALNQGDAYPDRMVEPDLSGYQREPPDYDEVLARVLVHSAEMNSAKLELEAARQHLKGLSVESKPVLGARLEAAEYSDQAFATRDQFRASLYLKFPIANTRQRQGEIQMASAKVMELAAQQQALENKLRVEVLRLVQQLIHLETEIRAAEAELHFSELELDRVRLLYEMEVRARIGSANAMVAAAVYRVTRAHYQRALAWSRLDILMNNEPVSFE